MFKRSLTEVDKIFTTNLYSEFTVDQWGEKQHIFWDIFIGDIKRLLDISLKKLFNDIFQYSKSEYIFWPPNGIKIVECRIRPQNEYYDALGKPIPIIDNPKGPYTAGIEVSIGVCRGRRRDKVIYPPFIEIKFKIWGNEERNGFISFFKNYRRYIEILLRDLELELFTVCCFKNLDKYKGTDIIKKLDLYLSNKKDEEASFSIGKSFNKNAKVDKVIKIIKNLLIIYHCCFGYCKKDKELDRLFNLCLPYVN